MTTTKTLDHIRVVINISDDESINHNINYFKANYLPIEDIHQLVLNDQYNSPPIRSSQSSAGSEDNMKAEVLLIDDKCLQLNLLSTEEDDVPYTNISHKMHFDHVNSCYINLIKSELAIVMDDLLLKHINSCIIRFSNHLEADITIFFDLFITFLNKRIYHQKYKLQYVKLECLDIAATVGNTGTQPSETGFTMRASIAPDQDSICDDDSYNNDATFRLIGNTQNNFRNTRDLLLWLCNEYRYKFSEHHGHEKLQFTFSILDHHQNVFKVKLSLFNIYMDLMKTEERNHWLHFMDHMGDGCRGQDCNFIHSGLTISLSGHIEGIASRNTLFLFTIPTDIRMTADTIEMLQMANAVIQNRKKKHIRIVKTVANLNRCMTLPAKEHSKDLLPSKEDELRNNLSANQNKERRSSLSLTEDQTTKKYQCHYNLRNANQISNVRALVDSPYSSNDFNTLSGWYRKIDERYNRVCRLREKYFDLYFELKSNEISTNIKHMCNSLESLYKQNTEGNIVELEKNRIELHELFEHYHNSRTLFRQLTDNIQQSEFEELLKIYLDTKTFDLNQHALNLKRKHIELSSQQIKLTLNKLASDLE